MDNEVGVVLLCYALPLLVLKSNQMGIAAKDSCEGRQQINFQTFKVGSCHTRMQKKGGVFVSVGRLRKQVQQRGETADADQRQELKYQEQMKDVGNAP